MRETRQNNDSLQQQSSDDVIGNIRFYIFHEFSFFFKETR
jgi:hypothetical protein